MGVLRGTVMSSVLSLHSLQSNMVTRRLCLPYTSRSAQRIEKVAAGLWLGHVGGLWLPEDRGPSVAAELAGRACDECVSVA